MCGIAGIWGKTNETDIQTMIMAQRHRGPDGEGVHIHDAQGILGHSRLAIMDPKHGQQPIYNEDKSATLVANGMVYNHPQLRHQLSNNHEFSSDSDSETILHLYEDETVSTPNYLDGMFAFAVAEGDQLMMARDRIGIKPLYFAKRSQSVGNDTLYFASEMKALMPITDDIKEFPPGTVYHSEAGFQRYYQVPNHAPLDLDIESHIRRIRKTIVSAVKKRLLSDVPLGSFLSGGLDSSIIAAVARQYMPELHTFSVGTASSSDLKAARSVAEHIGSIHHEYIYTPEEVTEKLPEIIFHLESFDQDLVRCAIPTWFCARMASEHVKVILTGEGADELFAGYTYHKQFTDYKKLHRELRRSITGMHNINLQRVDRMTMRHGLEARVPFLDTDSIAMSQTVPPELKQYNSPNGQRIEKWILRKAFEDLLPKEIVWRDKEQFDEGSGIVDIIHEALEHTAASIDGKTYKKRFVDDQLRSNEECYYHHLVMEQFENPEAVLKNSGRWDLEQTD
jgi:asparagine synthase (glutamine-hydrolysing)